MATYKLKISTPDGDMLSEQVEGLFLRGADGDLAVLAGHIPFVTTIQPGECRVEFEDGSMKSGEVKGGILTVSEKETVVLSASFNWKE